MTRKKYQSFTLILAIFLFSKAALALPLVKTNDVLSKENGRTSAFIITSNISISVVDISTVSVGNTGSGDTILVSKNN